MTRLKPFSKSSAKNALLLVNFFLTFLLSGCQSNIEPSYKEKDIPSLVKKICQKEYSLNVATRRTATTLWVYAPLTKILDKEFGIKEDKIFDEEIMEKLRNIMTTTGRVLISADNTPDFYALNFSDIILGIDYVIIGNVLDMKKSYSSAIPWTEANRRYVMRLNAEPKAIGDTVGRHLRAYNIKLPDFITEQIAQRISAGFQQEGRKKYFKVEKVTGKYLQGTLIFEYSITQLQKENSETEIKKEMLQTIAYVIKAYEFKDFSEVILLDLKTQEKNTYSEAAIWAMPTG